MGPSILVLVGSLSLALVFGITTSTRVRAIVLDKAAEHDIPLEWGGGAAHQALARQGKAGFDALVRKALAKGENTAFAENAIGKIDDADLVPELAGLAGDSTKPYKLRFAAVSAIADIARTHPPTQPVLLALLAKGDASLKRMASGYVQRLGTPEALAALEAASKDPQLDAEFRRELAYALAIHGPDQAIERMMDDLVSGNTSRNLKNEILNQLGSRSPAAKKLIDRPGYFDILSRGLRAVGKTGEPDNETRTRVWLIIYHLYGRRMPLELMYPAKGADDSRLRRAAGSVFNTLVRELMDKNQYSVPQCRALALDELKRFVTRYKEVGDDVE